MPVLCSDIPLVVFWQVELEFVQPELSEKVKAKCESFNFSLLSLPSLTSTLTVASVYVFTFYMILTSSQQQRRSTGNEAGREYTWPRKGCEDRMGKPAGMTRGILSVLPSGTASPYASASRTSASSLSFCRLPFSALSVRRTGGWVRCSTENKPSF